jgi:hypothetical protein
MPASVVRPTDGPYPGRLAPTFPTVILEGALSTEGSAQRKAPTPSSFAPLQDDTPEGSRWAVLWVSALKVLDF